jgi:phosphate transport system ATP-binding protein
VRAGRIIEYDETEHVFTNPSDPRTEAYVSGRVG